MGLTWVGVGVCEWGMRTWGEWLKEGFEMLPPWLQRELPMASKILAAGLYTAACALAVKWKMDWLLGLLVGGPVALGLFGFWLLHRSSVREIERYQKAEAFRKALEEKRKL